MNKEETKTANQNDEDVMLSSEWTIWYERQKMDSGLTESDYLKELTNVGTFKSLKGLWQLWKGVSLDNQGTIHIFKHDIKPIWEDPANQDGGKWVVTINREHDDYQRAMKMWFAVVVAVLCGQLQYSDDMCGVVLALRNWGTGLHVWNMHSDNVEQQEVVKTILHKLLKTKKIKYIRHKTSIMKNISSQSDSDTKEKQRVRGKYFHDYDSKRNPRASPPTIQGHAKQQQQQQQQQPEPTITTRPRRYSVGSDAPTTVIPPAPAKNPWNKPAPSLGTLSENEAEPAPPVLPAPSQPTTAPTEKSNVNPWKIAPKKHEESAQETHEQPAQETHEQPAQQVVQQPQQSRPRQHSQPAKPLSQLAQQQTQTTQQTHTKQQKSHEPQQPVQPQQAQPTKSTQPVQKPIEPQTEPQSQQPTQPQQTAHEVLHPQTHAHTHTQPQPQPQPHPQLQTQTQTQSQSQSQPQTQTQPQPQQPPHNQQWRPKNPNANVQPKSASTKIDQAPTEPAKEKSLPQAPVWDGRKVIEVLEKADKTDFMPVEEKPKVDPQFGKLRSRKYATEPSSGEEDTNSRRKRPLLLPPTVTSAPVFAHSSNPSAGKPPTYPTSTPTVPSTTPSAQGNPEWSTVAEKQKKKRTASQENVFAAIAEEQKTVLQQYQLLENIEEEEEEQREQEIAKRVAKESSVAQAREARRRDREVKEGVNVSDDSTEGEEGEKGETAATAKSSSSASEDAAAKAPSTPRRRRELGVRHTKPQASSTSRMLANVKANEFENLKVLIVAPVGMAVILLLIYLLLF